MKTETLVKCVLMLAAVIVLGMMVKRYNERNQEVVVEENGAEGFQDNVTGAEAANNAGPQDVDFPTQQQPTQCFPRDRLTADDLLPKDAANSKFAQVNPAGQGDVDGANFLTAGNKIGINSVGTSLRNANQQLRSEPPNPQVQVSPWMQTTIQPDLNRRPLE
mgnify:FL=1